MIGIAHDYRASLIYKFLRKVSQSMLVVPREDPGIVFYEPVVTVGDSIRRIEIDGISLPRVSNSNGKISQPDCRLLQFRAYLSQVLFIKYREMRFVSVWNVELSLLVLPVNSVERKAR